MNVIGVTIGCGDHFAQMAWHAAERFTAGADYGHYDGEVFFVDATVLEMDLTGVASEGWRDHVAELRVVSLECKHSELMDAEVLDRLGPLLAPELTD